MSQIQLTGVKCKRCGKVVYLRRLVCFGCKGRDFMEVKIGSEGTLLTFTHLYVTPEGIEQVPLTLGIIEFENGIKVMGQIESRDIKIGDKLRPVEGFLRKKQGKEIYGIKFELIPKPVHKLKSV